MELLVCFTFAFPLNLVLNLHLRSFKLSALCSVGPSWNHFLLPGRKVYEKHRLGCQRERNCFEAFTNWPWKTSTWWVETWLLRTHLLVRKIKLFFHVCQFCLQYVSLLENPYLIKKGCMYCMERHVFWSAFRCFLSFVLFFFCFVFLKMWL